MANIQRILVVWAGTTGLPGVSVHYGTTGGTANADLKTFFTSVAGVFPLGLQWTIPGNGDEVDENSGTLSGTWTNSGGGGVVAASGAAQHAAGVGAYVNWNTGSIINGRRLKGRTFLAPLMNSAYDSSGTIVTGNLTTLQNAANTLVTAGQIRVWHRPGAGVGVSIVPSSATVPDQVTSLRSRRR